MKNTFNKKIELLHNFIEVQEKYIKLLSDELDETVPIAFNHGWQSNRYAKGASLRADIERIKNQIKEENY